ncbi:uncharacterized protein SCHCODRAFT_01359435 [Schizophyllum commune H4-8]|uniref:uncharacterized protein n=1 Tax=Schizophyllum commune (strain H4-8 / FGSC 9210) TaxID=578458 RepID=UPI00215F2757|nr:uncharacterized protein SCHCODRAFT_01359435 [Schizophyllum commune H4-8]KAI5888656.1 hypothetical protein SCHCODRAFT_01359435 [Schizophyllum commune H4-8]
MPSNFGYALTSSPILRLSGTSSSTTLAVAIFCSPSNCHFLGCSSRCLVSPRLASLARYFGVLVYMALVLVFFGHWCLIFEGLGGCNVTVTGHVPQLYKAGFVLL